MAEELLALELQDPEKTIQILHASLRLDKKPDQKNQNCCENRPEQGDELPKR